MKPNVKPNMTKLVEPLNTRHICGLNKALTYLERCGGTTDERVG